jgi:alkaline phosphatase D
VTRRRFLEMTAALGTGAIALPLIGSLDLAGGASPAALPPGYVPSYPDGVISGDPTPTGGIIWTRLGPPAAPAPLPVMWEVATDETFATIVAGGTADALPEHDYTVKVPVDGLDPHNWYHYRFTAGATVGPVGRLRTAPSPGSSPDQLVFAWGSCQQRNSSLYVAHRAMAEEPGLDFWMHLGDYIYVSDGGTLTLDDYRQRYHTFKSNPYLQQLQATVPTVAMYDDGEFVNGIDKTLDPTRMANALQSWFENFPVIPPDSDPTQAYRGFQWGDLVDTFMIDVRQYRDPAIEEINSTTPDGRAMFDPSRTTLGATQKSWLKDALSGSGAAWRFLGNPYNMGMWRLVDLDEPWPRPDGVHPNEGVFAPNEAWDDYWAERKELLDHIRDGQISNVVSVSGHTHIWLADVLKPDPDDPDSPVVAYDFTCGSLTADPDVLLEADKTPEQLYGEFAGLQDWMRSNNPWKAYINFVNQGYGLATITPEQAVIEFKAINVYDDNAEPEVIARFTIESCATTMKTEVWTMPNYHAEPPITAAGEPTVFDMPAAGAVGAACAPPGDGGSGSIDSTSQRSSTTNAAGEATPRFTG